MSRCLNAIILLGTQLVPLITSFKTAFRSFRTHSNRFSFPLSSSSDHYFQPLAAMDTTLESFLKNIYMEIQSTLHANIDHAEKSTSLELSPRFNAVLGNEAGDADSIISSIVLAYILQLGRKYYIHQGNLHASQDVTLNEPSMDKQCAVTNLSSYFFPLISIPRKEMALRRDVTLILALCRIHSIQGFLYIDDTSRDEYKLLIAHHNSVSFSENHSSDFQSSVLQFTLVDHNKIRESLWHLRDQVAQIWDHHSDEGFHENVYLRNVAFDSLTMSALVGSTCTLVTEELQRVFMSRNGNTDISRNSDIDPAIGLALLSVILLDTMNMSKEAGKGTERDQRAIEFILQHTRWDCFVAQDDPYLKSYYERIFQHRLEETARVESHPISLTKPNLTALYEILRDCKFDPAFWLEMSAEDALRIDYKKFGSSMEPFTFGLSSVLLSCNALQQKEDFLVSAIKFAKDQRIEILGILSLVVDDKGPRREISLIGPENVVRSLTRYLVNSDDALFLGVRTPSEEKSQIISLHGSRFLMTELQQDNSKASRKQIAPIIQSFGSQRTNGTV